jgi:predicted RNA-binding Zn-ribbon protein involved in translation (DUF1610 family)
MRIWQVFQLWKPLLCTACGRALNLQAGPYQCPHCGSTEILDSRTAAERND